MSYDNLSINVQCQECGSTRLRTTGTQSTSTPIFEDARSTDITVEMYCRDCGEGFELTIKNDSGPVEIVLAAGE